jgi:hypothetical protein
MKSGKSKKNLMAGKTKKATRPANISKRRRDYLLNKLLYLTGGRIFEVLALRWSHIYATDKGGEMKIIRVPSVRRRGWNHASVPANRSSISSSFRSRCRGALS